MFHSRSRLPYPEEIMPMRSVVSAFALLVLLGHPVAAAVVIPPSTTLVEQGIAVLGAGDAEALTKPTAKSIKTFIDKYVDRIEAWHVANSSPAPALLECFKTNGDLRREFWLAISPRHDDAKAALAIMEALRAKDARKLAQYKHLAIAIAVVHDQPGNASRSRHFCLWGVQDQQFGKPLEWEAVWNYFTDVKRQDKFVFKPQDLAWPLMVHLVDLDVGQDEIAWLDKEFSRFKLTNDMVGDFYAMVPYDYDKLSHKGTGLGDKPYVLENLKKYGGVCVDQAHFASRMAKLFGVPSMKCAGQGRYGGAGHAWSGFLAIDAKTRFPLLSFTGRYQYDYYYTGNSCDPQTGTPVLDRAIELLYAGVSGRYESYVNASILTRAALSLEADQPVLALALVKEAFKQNDCIADAWHLAMRLAVAKIMTIKDTERVWLTMTQALVLRHPDLVADCLPIYLQSPSLDTDAKRHKTYLDTYAAFGLAKRPDLQIKIRLMHLDELAQKNRSKEVVQLAFEAVGPNIKEGAMVMPLVQRVVELSKAFAVSDKTFQIQMVKSCLEKYAADFPKQRGNDVAPAWLEFERLMKSL